MSSINNSNFEENMVVEHVLTVTSPTVDPTILNAKESVERQISMLSKVYTSTLDPTEMKQVAKALDQCNKSRQERCKELFELNALINGPSQIRAVVSEAASSSASVSNVSREDTSLNPDSLPRLQWRNADGTDVIVDPKREIFQSATEAVQVLGWQFFPPGTDPKNSTVDWRELVQRVMNGEQLMWYRKTFLENHPDLSSITWKMFSHEFLARHGIQRAFMYEPLKKLLEFTHIRMNPTRETIDAYLLRFNQERLLAELPDNATMAHLLLQGLTNTFKTRDETEEIALLSYRLEFPTGVSSFVNTRSPSYTPTYITVDDMELVEAPIVKKKGKN
ncbi:hypothetical protein G6F56_002489 [Rhizopus delemar]|nr:hypothetical protein G6F56_002489 [Rhizopus delemar]